MKKFFFVILVVLVSFVSCKNHKAPNKTPDISNTAGMSSVGGAGFGGVGGMCAVGGAGGTECSCEIAGAPSWELE